MATISERVVRYDLAGGDKELLIENPFELQNSQQFALQIFFKDVVKMGGGDGYIALQISNDNLNWFTPFRDPLLLPNSRKLHDGTYTTFISVGFAEGISASAFINLEFFQDAGTTFTGTIEKVLYSWSI